jgi:hypothetical protein
MKAGKPEGTALTQQERARRYAARKQQASQQQQQASVLSPQHQQAVRFVVSFLDAHLQHDVTQPAETRCSRTAAAWPALLAEGASLCLLGTCVSGAEELPPFLSRLDSLYECAGGGIQYVGAGLDGLGDFEVTVVDVEGLTVTASAYWAAVALDSGCRVISTDVTIGVAVQVLGENSFRVHSVVVDQDWQLWKTQMNCTPEQDNSEDHEEL